MPDSLAGAPRYWVLRRELHDFHYTERIRVPVARTTYGGLPDTYTVTDTLLRPGYYLYQMVADAGPNGQPPTLLKQQWVSFSQLNSLLNQFALCCRLASTPRHSRLSIVISNQASGQVLLARQLVCEPSDTRQGWLLVSKWQEAGIEKVAVEITCHPWRSDFFTDRLLLSLLSPAARP